MALRDICRDGYCCASNLRCHSIQFLAWESSSHGIASLRKLHRLLLNLEIPIRLNGGPVHDASAGAFYSLLPNPFLLSMPKLKVDKRPKLFLPVLDAVEVFADEVLHVGSVEVAARPRFW